MNNTHKPFHQKYRPKRLDELIGQEFIAITLKQALLSGKIAPAYLFNGPRGTGKTSSARIFAKSLNCLSFNDPTSNPCDQCELCRQINEGNALDIIEIDAASNTGVENIREIIERARFSPSQARWKVYVIDECHMLSTAASNALLKTIEEPPAKVVFILATTNPERVLTTIQSRCQKFDFKRINSNDIFQHLSQIAEKESIQFQDQALKLIAKRSNGGMRDAQSLLDQLSLLPNGITTKDVQNILGEVSEVDLINLINSLINNNPESLLKSCNTLYNAGNEPNQIIIGLLNITRDLLLNSKVSSYTELYYTPYEFKSELDKFESVLEKSRIIDWHNKLRNVEYQLKTSDNPRLWLEIHLTSLLKKEDKEDLNNNQINLKDQKIIRNIEKKSISEKIDIKKFSNKENISNKIESQNEDKRLDDVKLVKNELISKNIEKNDQNIELKDKWELILSKLELPSTKMLLTQQAELVSFESDEIDIALSPNWENMIKSRKFVIENAVKKIFGEKIKIKFSRKQINANTTIRKSEETTNNNKLPETINDKESPFHKNPSQEKNYDNSSKNLANFFNGEIIDLEE